MPDVMEVSDQERRRIKKMIAEFCADRDERHRMQRTINDLYCLHALEREPYDER